MWVVVFFTHCRKAFLSNACSHKIPNQYCAIKIWLFPSESKKISGYKKEVKAGVIVIKKPNSQGWNLTIFDRNEMVIWSNKYLLAHVRLEFASFRLIGWRFYYLSYPDFIIIIISELLQEASSKQNRTVFRLDFDFTLDFSVLFECTLDCTHPGPPSSTSLRLAGSSPALV